MIHKYVTYSHRSTPAVIRHRIEHSEYPISNDAVAAAVQTAAGELVRLRSVTDIPNSLLPAVRELVACIGPSDMPSVIGILSIFAAHEG